MLFIHLDCFNVSCRVLELSAIEMPSVKRNRNGWHLACGAQCTKRCWAILYFHARGGIHVLMDEVIVPSAKKCKSFQCSLCSSCNVSYLVQFLLCSDTGGRCSSVERKSTQLSFGVTSTVQCHKGTAIQKTCNLREGSHLYGWCIQKLANYTETTQMMK